MTFDQWIDAVNAQVRERLGSDVRTEELSWDSAIWKSVRGGTAVAALADDGVTANVFFDGGDKITLGFAGADASPAILGAAIAKRLATS